jgi:hypothetical protein
MGNILRQRGDGDGDSAQGTIGAVRPARIEKLKREKEPLRRRTDATPSRSWAFPSDSAAYQISVKGFLKLIESYLNSIYIFFWSFYLFPPPIATHFQQLSLLQKNSPEPRLATGWTARPERLLFSCMANEVAWTSAKNRQKRLRPNHPRRFQPRIPPKPPNLRDLLSNQLHRLELKHNRNRHHHRIKVRSTGNILSSTRELAIVSRTSNSSGLDQQRSVC